MSMRKLICFAVAEEKSGLRLQLAAALQVIQVRVKGDLAQHHNNLYVTQRGKFAIKVGRAGGNLFWRRLVLWWSATDGGGDVGIQQAEAIATMCGGGL